MIWLELLLVVMFFFAVNFLYLAWYQRCGRRNTSGMAYYGLPLAERRALKDRIRRYSLPALPVVRLLAIGHQKQANMPGFEYEGEGAGSQGSASRGLRERQELSTPTGTCFRRDPNEIRHHLDATDYL